MSYNNCNDCTTCECVTYCCKGCGHKKKLKILVPLTIVGASAYRVANQNYDTTFSNVLYDAIDFNKVCTSCKPRKKSCRSRCGGSCYSGCGCGNSSFSNCGGCGGCNSCNQYACYFFYDSTKGVATVPPGGQGCYNICASVVVESENDTTVQLMRNNTILTQAVIGGSTSCDRTGLSAFTQLCDCDNIYVRIMTSSGTGLITPTDKNVIFNASRVC